MSSVHHYYIWVRVIDRGREGAEYTISLESPEEGISPIKRYFTDDTLPEELKWKLGILNANYQVAGVGHKYSDEERNTLYFIESTEGLHDLLLDGAT